MLHFTNGLGRLMAIAVIFIIVFNVANEFAGADPRSPKIKTPNSGSETDCVKCTEAEIKKSQAAPLDEENQTKTLLQLANTSMLENNTRCLNPETSPLRNCGFEKMIQTALACGTNQCQEALHQQACRDSMWKGKDLSERVNSILSIASSIDTSGIDARALVCLAAKETERVEPLTVEFIACGGRNKKGARGLGQITFPTFQAMLKGTDRVGAFSSKIKPFNEARFYANGGEALFDAMATSVPLQLEFIAAVLKAKMPPLRGRAEASLEDYKTAFARYGPPNRPAYAASVSDCFRCLRTGATVGGKKVTDSVDCLQSVMSSRLPSGKLATPQVTFEAHKERCARMSQMKCLGGNGSSL